MASQFHLVGRIAVDVETPTGGGEGALCIHGLGGTSNSWTPLAPALSRFTAVRFDLPGSGRSHRVEGALSIDGFVEACRARAGELQDGARPCARPFARHHRRHPSGRARAAPRAQPGAVRPAAGAARRGADRHQGARRQGARRGRGRHAGDRRHAGPGGDLGRDQGPASRGRGLCARDADAPGSRGLRPHLRRAGRGRSPPMRRRSPVPPCW